MATSTVPRSTADLELERLHQEERKLLAKQKEMAELPKLLEREKRERESTMPPLSDIHDRTRTRRHEEEIATRGAVRNIQKTQNRSLLLLFMLILATCALVAWGIRLMQG